MEALCCIDEPQSGLMNMAIDDAMLELADESQTILLRVYQWSEPTLSLGYFQRVADRQLHLESRPLPIVRRATGGGAIVHHHDVTYALAVPQASGRTGAAPSVYSAVHSVVVDWLGEMGLRATQWQETYNLPTPGMPGGVSASGEFLCFHRRSDGDVVVNGSKVMGSAQRRGKHAVLQHGSLLLGRSCFAPSLAGLEELLPGGVEVTAKSRLFADELALRIQRGIDAVFGVGFKWDASLATKLHALASVKLARFESESWLFRL